MVSFFSQSPVPRAYVKVKRPSVLGIKIPAGEMSCPCHRPPSTLAESVTDVFTQIVFPLSDVIFTGTDSIIEKVSRRS